MRNVLLMCLLLTLVGGCGNPFKFDPATTAMRKIMCYSHRIVFSVLILVLANMMGCAGDPPEVNLPATSDQPTAANPADASEPSFLVAQNKLTNKAFNRLEPTAITSWTRVSRIGDHATAKVRVTNRDERTINSVAFELVRLDKDGQYRNSPGLHAVPHGAGGLTLAKGESKTFDINEMFLRDQVGAVEALITEIEYTDGTKWPPMSSGLTGHESADPVIIRMIGYVSSDSYSEAVLACVNIGPKPLKEIDVTIEYLDANGQELDSSSTGWGGDWQIAPGQGDVLCGGDRPSKHAVDAKVKIRRVKFTDDSTWEPAGK